MKTKSVIAGFLIANVIALWCLAHHYEFHTGMDGRLIWRCNNFTGKVQSSSFGGTWITISDPKPKISAEDFLDGKIDSAGVPVTVKKRDVFDEVDTNSPTTNTALPDFGNK
jgi:hypothetical protein